MWVTGASIKVYRYRYRMVISLARYVLLAVPQLQEDIPRHRKENKEKHTHLTAIMQFLCAKPWDYYTNFNTDCLKSAGGVLGVWCGGVL